jgi:hypothetical protein
MYRIGITLKAKASEYCTMVLGETGVMVMGSPPNLGFAPVARRLMHMRMARLPILPLRTLLATSFMHPY